MNKGTKMNSFSLYDLLALVVYKRLSWRKKVLGNLNEISVESNLLLVTSVEKIRK